MRRHSINPLRDENERPLREKSIKILSEETWCMLQIRWNTYLSFTFADVDAFICRLLVDYSERFWLGDASMRRLWLDIFGTFLSVFTLKMLLS
uniref:Uncharacterized protein n=1 Tax=Fagus sylvatica TaxID=28930 RepID=A0A2N9F5I2_FAGSY